MTDAERADTTRALIKCVLGGTRHARRGLELVDDPECKVIEADGAAIIYAPVAGASDVVKLHLQLGGAGILRALPPARICFAEVPDEAPYAAMIAALLANGFREEGRIDAYVAEAIALRLLVKRTA